MKTSLMLGLVGILLVAVTMWLFATSTPALPRQPSVQKPENLSVPATTTSSIQPKIVKARAADGKKDVCVAPCGVHFDATESTWTGHSAEEKSLDLEYRWDFGDPTCSGDGRFDASARSCNEANGFVAGHLFEAPGTHQVRLCVLNGAEGACRSTDVVVSDGDVVYPGEQTVCVSTNGDHAGCPPGATRVSSSDFVGSLQAHVRANKRVLFRRGQTFRASGSFRFTRSHRNVLIGAYGAGAKPRIGASGITVFRNTCDGPGQTGPSPVDTRIIELEFRDGASLLELGDPAKQLTVAHVDLTGSWSGSDFGQIYQWRDSISYCESGSPGPAEQWFLVENDHAPSSQGRNLSMTARRSAALGNIFRGAPNDHVVRWLGTERNVISHNQWVGLPKTGLHQLKYHAGNYDDGDFGGVNEYSVISHNFCSGGGPWPFTLGQEGQDGSPTSELQRAAWMLVEHNYFKDADGSVQIFVRVDADRARFSHNVCEQKVKGADGITCVDFGVRDPWPMAGRHRAHWNILLDTVTHDLSSVTVHFEIGSGNQASNNIVWAPSSGDDKALAGTATCAPGACAPNWRTRDFRRIPFVSSEPDALRDYELRGDLPPNGN